MLGSPSVLVVWRTHAEIDSSATSIDEFWMMTLLCLLDSPNLAFHDPPSLSSGSFSSSLVATSNEVLSPSNMSWAITFSVASTDHSPKSLCLCWWWIAGLGLTTPETCTPFAICFRGQEAWAVVLGVEELLITEAHKKWRRLLMAINLLILMDHNMLTRQKTWTMMFTIKSPGAAEQ